MGDHGNGGPWGMGDHWRRGAIGDHMGSWGIGAYAVWGNMGDGGGIRDWLNAVNMRKRHEGRYCGNIFVREEMRHTQKRGS